MVACLVSCGEESPPQEGELATSRTLAFLVGEGGPECTRPFSLIQSNPIQTIHYPCFLAQTPDRPQRAFMLVVIGKRPKVRVPILG